ncbi:MAG: EAL domain-containing protein, partial [Gammaproteobacteria bacterium]|nr:EAL domain-containing protein [Gammaproteobacteria bacterium]
DVNILMQRADVAMYNAKNNRSGFNVYESSEDSHAVSRLALAAELRQALNNNVLRLFYQPKINLESGEIFGAEALLRWEHPERGFISPGDFIPLAGHTGLIQAITCWVIENASKQCSLWNDLGHKLRISINISTNCIHDARLPVKLNEVILKNKLTPDQLTLELTENIFIKDPVRSKKILDNVSKMGIGISIDDFGTGYSSLSYLKQLPINKLKIDRSFVSDISNDKEDATLVQAIIAMGKSLDLRLVAEGVEHHSHETFLSEHGCEYAQGYLYSKPVTAAEIEDMLIDKDAERRKNIKLISTSPGK